MKNQHYRFKLRKHFDTHYWIHLMLTVQYKSNQNNPFVHASIPRAKQAGRISRRFVASKSRAKSADKRLYPLSHTFSRFPLMCSLNMMVFALSPCYPSQHYNPYTWNSTLCNKRYVWLHFDKLKQNKMRVLFPKKCALDWLNWLWILFLTSLE